MRFLLEQGVTVVHACPGRANVIGGMTGVFRTHGRTAESMAVKIRGLDARQRAVSLLLDYINAWREGRDLRRVG